MQVSFDVKDFISEFIKYKKFFRKTKNVVRIYACNKKIEFASFNLKTKAEVGSFIDGSVPESGSVILNFPAANFYDMCDSFAKQFPDGYKLKLYLEKEGTILVVTSDKSIYRFPVLSVKESGY